MHASIPSSTQPDTHRHSEFQALMTSEWQVMIILVKSSCTLSQLQFTWLTTHQHRKMPNRNAARGKKMSPTKKIQAPGKPTVVCSTKERIPPNKMSDAKIPPERERCSHLQRSLCKRQYRHSHATRQPTWKRSTWGHQGLQLTDQSRCHSHL